MSTFWALGNDGGRIFLGDSNFGTLMCPNVDLIKRANVRGFTAFFHVDSSEPKRTPGFHHIVNGRVRAEVGRSSGFAYAIEMSFPADLLNEAQRLYLAIRSGRPPDVPFDEGNIPPLPRGLFQLLRLWYRSMKLIDS